MQQMLRAKKHDRNEPGNAIGTNGRRRHPEAAQQNNMSMLMY